MYSIAITDLTWCDMESDPGLCCGSLAAILMWHQWRQCGSMFQLALSPFVCIMLSHKFLLSSQTGFGPHPASCAVGTGALSTVVNRLVIAADHLLHLVKRVRMYGVLPPLPMYIFVVWCLIRGTVTCIFFTFVCNTNTVHFVRWSWIGYFRKVISYKEIKMVTADHLSEIQLVPQKPHQLSSDLLIQWLEE
jgi:hypothetical protein